MKKVIIYLVILAVLTLSFSATSTNAQTVGWKYTNNSWYYYNYSKTTQKGWLLYKNSWYYFGTDGKMKTGWIRDGGKWYFLHSSGIMARGWVYSGGKWYYLDNSGVMRTGWLLQNKVWYYLNPSGAMATGWVTYKNQYYYMKASGAMTTGWVQDQNKHFYLEPSGARRHGWFEQSGKKFYFLPTGEMAVGSVVIDNKPYSFDQNGILTNTVVVGWVHTIHGSFYYNQDGTKVTGWLSLDSRTYYFDNSGILVKGWTVIDGAFYYFDSSGILYKGWLTTGGYSYYLSPEDGKMVTGWLESNGKWYYLFEDGKMATGEVVIDGKTYHFFTNGELNTGSIVTYTSYNYTIQDAVSIQMGLSSLPQTDKYRYDKSFVHGAYLHFDQTDPLKATVTANLNVREGPSTTNRIIGTFKLGEVITTFTKNGDWYEVKYGPWKNATAEDVAYYVNPANFNPADTTYFQFLLLSKNAGISYQELNEKILKGKGTLENQGQKFVEASLLHSVNEIYLISHALHETGGGTSELARGVLVSEVNGLPVTPKIVYNMYGIQAFDHCAVKCGSEYAYTQNWTSPEASIVGGAKFIGENYIHHATYKQDTLYKMRWNPAKPGTHQYATDIGWSVKQVSNISKLYQLLTNYTLYYDVPVYK